jgi:hypothetical protein
MYIPHRLGAGPRKRACTAGFATMLLCACTTGNVSQSSTTSQQPLFQAASAEPIGVVSANEDPTRHASEIQRGLVRTEEAVGFFGAGLGAGLAALAACAPTVFLAPLCAIVAATAGVGGAALGGLAGDVAADVNDAKRNYEHVKSGVELQEELRLRVIDRLRETGYVVLDLGSADDMIEPPEGMPSLVIKTTLRRIAAEGTSRDHFTVSLQSSFRPLLPHELVGRPRSTAGQDSEQSTIPTGKFEDRTGTFAYVSPPLPLGTSVEETGRAIQTGISAGIAEMAAGIASADLERLRRDTTQP